MPAPPADELGFESIERLLLQQSFRRDPGNSNLWTRGHRRQPRFVAIVDLRAATVTISSGRDTRSLSLGMTTTELDLGIHAALLA